MEHITPGIFGLWIFCTVAFITSVTAFVTAYRLLTKNFVTHEFLKSEMLQLEQRISKDIENSRHILRGEMQSIALMLGNKLDGLQETNSRLRESMARVEGHMGLSKAVGENPGA